MSSNEEFNNNELPDLSTVGRVLAESMQKYQKMMQPISEALQKHIEKYIEMMRSVSEALEPLNVRIGSITAQLAESMRPLVAISILGDAQYVFWDFLQNEFMEDIINTENINYILTKYEGKNNYNKSKIVIERILKHTFIEPRKQLFDQTLDAYHNGHFDLAVLGLIAVIDNVLSKASGNLTYRPLDRCNAILDKIKNKSSINSDEYAILALGITFNKVFNIFFKTIGFSEEEPEFLNRNWIMHGRSDKTKSRLDCIKLFYIIYGIILIDNLSINKEVT